MRLNCTGVLLHFCSLEAEDRNFGSCGAWSRDRDADYASAVANPPLLEDIMMELLQVFNANTRNEKRPYCCIAILSWTKTGLVRRELSRANFSGSIVAVVPPRQLGFRPYKTQFTEQEKLRYAMNGFIHIVNVAWTNEYHLVRRRTPENADRIFRNWVGHNCRDPSTVLFHGNQFEKRFPRRMRGPPVVCVCGCIPPGSTAVSQ